MSHPEDTIRLLWDIIELNLPPLIAAMRRTLGAPPPGTTP